MKRGVQAALPALAVILGTVVLAGCSGAREYRREMERMEKLTAEMARSYIEENYGFAAEIQEIKVGTYQSGFSSYVDTDALVTVTVGKETWGEETFQVYVETEEPAFCRDNREGLFLAWVLDKYFRELYRLPPGWEQEVRVYTGGEDHFAARTTHLAHDYSFLNFEYRGQPLEEVFPLLDYVSFSYDYLYDGISLDQAQFRDEDWGGDAGKVRARLRCFRTYREDAPVPIGIGFEEEHPVLMAEGMQFSRRGKDHGTLDQIAEALPAFALRESLTCRDGESLYARYELTPMGNFWVSTREGLSAEDCFTLTAAAPDWTGETEKIGDGRGIYYTREEILEGSKPDKTTRKTLLPFVGSRYQQEGEMLLPRDGAMERMAAWNEEKPSWDHSNLLPVQVMVDPALVYESDAQMGAGLFWQREGERQQVVQLFTAYLDQRTRWTHGLTNLTFPFPGSAEGIALVRVADP